MPLKSDVLERIHELEAATNDSRLADVLRGIVDYAEQVAESTAKEEASYQTGGLLDQIRELDRKIDNL